MEAVAKAWNQGVLGQPALQSETLSSTHTQKSWAWWLIPVILALWGQKAAVQGVLALEQAHHQSAWATKETLSQNNKKQACPLKCQQDKAFQNIQTWSYN